MSQLPYIFEFDEPEEWFIEVQSVADEIVENIGRVLDEHKTAEEAFEALQPLLEPYIIDTDDPTHHQIIADYSGDTLYIGRYEPDWFRLTYRDDGYWWFKRQQPDDPAEPESLHRQIGQTVIDTVSWGDEQIARERAENQKAKRRMLVPYLEAIEQAGGYEASAAQLRDDLREFVESCLPTDEDVELVDRSPSEDFTDFVILRDGHEQGHVLAVGPGESRKPERLQEAFGLDAINLQEGVLVVTDHLRFVWYPFLETSGASNELILPSKKDEDIVDYYYEIDWTVTQMIRSLMQEV